MDCQVMNRENDIYSVRILSLVAQKLKAKMVQEAIEQIGDVCGVCTVASNKAPYSKVWSSRATISLQLVYTEMYPIKLTSFGRNRYFIIHIMISVEIFSIFINEKCTTFDVFWNI